MLQIEEAYFISLFWMSLQISAGICRLNVSRFAFGKNDVQCSLVQKFILFVLMHSSFFSLLKYCVLNIAVPKSLHQYKQQREVH